MTDYNRGSHTVYEIKYHFVYNEIPLSCVERGSSEEIAGIAEARV